MSPISFYSLLEQGGSDGNFKRGIICIASQGGGLKIQLSSGVFRFKKLIYFIDTPYP